MGIVDRHSIQDPVRLGHLVLSIRGIPRLRYIPPQPKPAGARARGRTVIRVHRQNALRERTRLKRLLQAVEPVGLQALHAPLIRVGGYPGCGWGRVAVRGDNVPRICGVYSNNFGCGRRPVCLGTVLEVAINNSVAGCGCLGWGGAETVEMEQAEVDEEDDDKELDDDEEELLDEGGGAE